MHWQHWQCTLVLLELTGAKNGHQGSRLLVGRHSWLSVCGKVSQDKTNFAMFALN